MGYFSISGSGSLSNDPVYAPDSCTTPNLTSYTSPSFMENELKKLQKTRGHRLQHSVSNSTKRQRSQVPAAFNFPSSATGELSQTIPSSTSIVHCHNYVTNVFNVSNSQTRSNSGSESPGQNNIDDSPMYHVFLHKIARLFHRSALFVPSCSCMTMYYDYIIVAVFDLRAIAILYIVACHSLYKYRCRYAGLSWISINITFLCQIECRQIQPTSTATGEEVGK